MKLRLFALTLLLGASSFAHPAAPARALNLTDAQKSQMKSIREQTRSTVKPVAVQLHQNRQALKAAIKANDTTQIQALSKTQGELRGQIAAIRNQSRAQIYAGLTSDQRKMIDDRQGRLRQRLNQRLKSRPEMN